MPLKNFKEQYKKPLSTFGNVTKIKNNLAHKQRKERKERRTKEFEDNRRKSSNFSPISQEQRKKRRTNNFEDNRRKTSNFSTISQKHETKKKFLEWKAIRERKKEQESRKKKPPFVVGIVRHHYFSPVRTAKNPVTITKKKTIAEARKRERTNSNHQKTVTRAITRATEKRLLSKIIAKQKSPANDNNINKSFAPNNHKFKPPANVSKIPLFGKVYVEENNLTNENNISTRDNSTENAPVSSTNEFPTKDVTTKNNIEMPTEGNKEHTVEYFKHLLYKERDRLQKHCEHWMNMQLRDNIKEDIRYRINQAVGQTTLLLEKKFPQFYGLILICEGGDADKPIFCTDLHGFWDMMYLEVKDCDSRFAKLEELRARRWQEEQSFSANSVKKEADVKRHVVSMRQSLLRASISDQKKKEMAKMRDNKEAEINMNNEFVTPFTSGKKRQVRIEKSINSTHHRKCCKDLSKIYTSTPFRDEDKSGSSRLNMSASLVTLKVSQYNKSSIYMNDDAISCISFEQTPRKNTLEKLEKSKRNIVEKQSDLEIDPNSDDSLDDNSISTVIERTLIFKNS